MNADLSEKLRRMREHMLERDTELEGLQQELILIQNKLKQQKDSLDVSLTDKNVLENNLRLVQLDITSLTNKVKLLEEAIRRLQTGIDDTVERLGDADSIIDRVAAELRRLRSESERTEAENLQLERDLQVLENHLGLLEA